MMTNWTDLIDTDPVAAWRALEKVTAHDIVTSNPHADEYLRQEHLDLISNLAALCEALAQQLGNAGYPWAGGDPKRIMEVVMENARNPDGSRRFPEVK